MREKLIELVGQVQDCGCDVTDVVEMNYVENDVLVDHLIANGVTVQEWISVKDRLPKNIGLYLVIEKHWISGSPCIRIAKWNTVDWFTADRKSKEITPRVTHWMPLPQPPKGE